MFTVHANGIMCNVLGAGVHGILLVLHHLLCAGNHHDPNYDALSTPGPATLHMDGLAQGEPHVSLFITVGASNAASSNRSVVEKDFTNCVCVVKATAEDVFVGAGYACVQCIAEVCKW